MPRGQRPVPPGELEEAASSGTVEMEPGNGNVENRLPHTSGAH